MDGAWPKLLVILVVVLVFAGMIRAVVRHNAAERRKDKERR